MSPADFVAWAQGYYGPYPSGQRSDVREYLDALSGPELDELRAQMRAACPSHIGQVNGYPPDIQRMGELLPEVRRVAHARQREAREVEYARRFLPTPEQVDARQEGESDILLDWGEVSRLGRERARELHREREEKSKAG